VVIFSRKTASATSGTYFFLKLADRKRFIEVSYYTEKNKESIFCEYINAESQQTFRRNMDPPCPGLKNRVSRAKTCVKARRCIAEKRKLHNGGCESFKF
jgi:hypothetical protein